MIDAFQWTMDLRRRPGGIALVSNFSFILCFFLLMNFEC